MFEEESSGVKSQLAAVIDEVPRPVRRALAAWSLGSTVWATYKRAKTWHENHFTYTIAIEGNDELYPHIHEWLLNSIPTEQQRSIIVRSAARRRVSDGTTRLRRILEASPFDDDEEEENNLIAFYDGSRTQTVTIDGHKIKVTVEKDGNDRFKSEGGATAAMIQAGETVKLTASTHAGRDAIHRQLDKLHAQIHSGPPRIRMYVGQKWGDWTRRNGTKHRPIKTVVLREGQMERIMADLEGFLKSSKRYQELGMPHHRGYMFYGPPGTGKTSIARALASHYDLPLYILPLSDMESDTNLITLVSSVPTNAILLLEDIDIASAAREREDKKSKGTSMSGLLNALDGISTPDGMIVIMTSNHREELDEALLRSGRVDVNEKIGYVDDEQLCRLASYLTGSKIEGLTAPKKLVAADVVEVVKPHVLNNEAMKKALIERFGG